MNAQRRDDSRIGRSHASVRDHGHRRGRHVRESPRERNVRPRRPTSRTTDPVSTPAAGSDTARTRQPTRPRTASAVDRWCVPGSVRGGAVGDRVVDQHREAREPDHRAQVEHQHHYDGTDDEAGTVGHPEARVDRSQQLGTPRPRAPVRPRRRRRARDDAPGRAGQGPEITWPLPTRAQRAQPRWTGDEPDARRGRSGRRPSDQHPNVERPAPTHPGTSSDKPAGDKTHRRLKAREP